MFIIHVSKWILWGRGRYTGHPEDSDGSIWPYRGLTTAFVSDIKSGRHRFFRGDSDSECSFDFSCMVEIEVDNVYH